MTSTHLETPININIAHGYLPARSRSMRPASGNEAGQRGREGNDKSVDTTVLVLPKHFWRG